MPKPLSPNGGRAKPQIQPKATTEPMLVPTPKTESLERKGPVREFRHRNLRATIWKNDTDKGFMYNVTMTRMYRDGTSWKDSQSFGFDDLMNLAKLLADAHTYISMLREKDFVAGNAKSPTASKVQGENPPIG